MNNIVLKTLFFYNGIFLMAASMLGPLYAVYVERFVDGVMSVSISWSTFLISTTVFTFIVSKNGDKIKEREYLMLASYLIRAIGWLSLMFVHSLIFLVGVQIVLGLGEALGTPSFNAIFAEHLDKNKYVNEYSRWTLISNLFAAFGMLIGGVVVDHFGFKILFILMSIISIFVFFGLLFKPRNLL